MEHYTKYEYRVPMRDNVKLFVSIYAPKGNTQTYPILLKRTLYGVGLYGMGNFMEPTGPIKNYVENFVGR